MQQDERIKLIASFKRKAVPESVGKQLFEAYDQKKTGTLNRAAIRTLLADIQEAFGCPRVVPDEFVETAANEVQLHLDSEAKFSWLEFKAFLILQSDLGPFDFLHDRCCSFKEEHLSRSILLTRLPADTTKADIEGLFKGQPVLRTFIISCENKSRQALVEVKDMNDVASVVERIGATPTVRGSKVKLTRLLELRPEFPATDDSGLDAAAHANASGDAHAAQGPSLVAKGLSEAIILGSTVKASAAAFNDRHQISTTLSNGVSAVGAKLSSFDQKHKVACLITGVDSHSHPSPLFV